MIIESEQEEPVFDTEPYYRQGPLAEVDHQLSATWTTYHNMRQKDPRPTSAPSTAAGSGGAPMKAQGQRLARRVMKYEFYLLNYLFNYIICIELCVLKLFDFYWFSVMNYVIKVSFC